MIQTTFRSANCVAYNSFLNPGSFLAAQKDPGMWQTLVLDLKKKKKIDDRLELIKIDFNIKLQDITSDQGYGYINIYAYHSNC